MYWNCPGISGLQTPSDAVYFSLVTASTTGFGDTPPDTAQARHLASFQVVTSIFFLLSFFPCSSHEPHETTPQKTTPQTALKPHPLRHSDSEWR